MRGAAIMNIRRMIMGILSGNPQEEPLHYGEVFGTWSYLFTAKSAVAGYQMQLNHAGDDDLKKLLKDSIEAGQEEIKQVEKLLKENGIGLPPTAPEPPNACLDDIPTGARMPDPAIAAALSANASAGLVSCSMIIGQCIREDVAAMFAQFHMQKVQLGAKILKLNKEKGWLIPPPLHKNKNEHCE
jgi:spore coat protein CotF